jgi:hypothetical protein
MGFVAANIADAATSVRTHNCAIFFIFCSLFSFLILPCSLYYGVRAELDERMKPHSSGERVLDRRVRFAVGSPGSPDSAGISGLIQRVLQAWLSGPNPILQPIWMHTNLSLFYFRSPFKNDHVE